MSTVMCADRVFRHEKANSLEYFLGLKLTNGNRGKHSVSVCVIIIIKIIMGVLSFLMIRKCINVTI